MNGRYNKNSYTGSVIIQDFQMEEFVNLLLENDYCVQIERKNKQKIVVSIFEKANTDFIKEPIKKEANNDAGNN